LYQYLQWLWLLASPLLVVVVEEWSLENRA
jgi:hypothetical protein